MKKKLIVGTAVGAAGLMALTGATFAHGGDGASGSGVRERAAEILGIPPEDLLNAVQQARSEHRDQHIDERLADAVEAGTITQDDADAIMAWLDDRPGVVDETSGGRHGALRGIGLVVPIAGDEGGIDQFVGRLLDAEKITVDEAVELTEWLSSAPVDALSKLQPERDGREHRPRFRGRMFGEGPNGRLFEGRFQLRPYTQPRAPGMDDPGQLPPVTDGASAVDAAVFGDPV